jgi:hypothetical protein
MGVRDMVSLAILVLADWPWSSDVRVDDAQSSLTETAFAPCYAGWMDSRIGTSRFGFSASTDGGQSWGPNQLHHYPDRSHDADPVVGVDAYGDVHEIFVNYDLTWNATVVHRMSTDGGNTWLNFNIVSQNGGVDIADKPWLAFSLSTDTLYSCYALIHGYYEYSQGIYACRSTDRGQNWTDQKVSTFGMSCCRPFVCTDKGGNVFLMWMEYFTGAFFMSYSTDGSETWSDPAWATGVIMHVDHRANAIPWIVGDAPGTVYLVWPDEIFSSNYLYDVLFTATTDYGITWSTPVPVNTTTGRDHKACLPSLVLTPQGYLVLIWAQYKGSVARSERWSMEYAYSVDGGATWHITSGATGRISDEDFPLGPGYSGMEMGDYLTAYADSAYIYALWADDRDGIYRVYFSRALIDDLVSQDTREDASERNWSVIQKPGALILQLGTKANVSVRLYDISGREVSELFQGDWEQGQHEVGLPETLGTGTYLAVVRVDGEARTFRFTVPAR